MTRSDVDAVGADEVDSPLRFLGGNSMITPAKTFAIVGAGLAGARAAEALRDLGFGGRIVLIGDEVERPYERPPLSKDFLQGNSTRDKIYVHPDRWYDQHSVDLRLATRVTALEPLSQYITTDQGDRIRYDKLLLATGSTHRRLSVPGEQLPEVQYLRRVEDSERLKGRLRPGARIVLVGGGWVGLEVAAAARSAGAHVTLVEATSAPLSRVLGVEVGDFFANVHRDRGVDVRTNVHVTAIAESNGHVAGVRLSDGNRIAADTVLISIGALPNIDLAQAAGLQCGDGIVVDESMRTSDPNIYAAGDVANGFSPWLGRHLRLDHWSSAVHQPKIAAASMLGKTAKYDRLPYFFTDQYDLGMELNGFIEPPNADKFVIRGDQSKREFMVFWLDGRRITAAMSINVWESADPVRELIRGRYDADIDMLQDMNVSLAEVLWAAQTGKPPSVVRLPSSDKATHLT